MLVRVTVRPGDTLWYYSQLFRVPLTLVLDSNPDVDPARLSIGQRVEIPGFVLSTYTIQAGDTLWQLAVRQGINIDALFLVNPGIDPLRLQVGQRINWPIRVTWFVVEGQRPYDYAALVSDISRLVEIYPFLRQRAIGDSVMEKAIPELTVGRGGKRVHVNGSFHANEWITTPILMRFLNHYLLSLTNMTPIRGRMTMPFYEQAFLSMVPMVNPDGVDLVINGLPSEEPYRSQVLEINQGSTNFSGWKANIRGVDLNDQFPALWEIEAERRPSQPSPRDYPGPRPLSEPESQAMANLTRQSDFDRVLAFHTQGEVIYWGFLGLEPPESERLVNEFARVSGYRPIRYVDSYAGYKDWFIYEWQRPGFTMELGRGVNPLPLTQFNEIYEEALGILLASLYM
jgi:g-D-glutamyl-meso-diaminopimelate peptidase